MYIKSGPDFIALGHLQIFSAVCLSVFLFMTAVFSHTPPLRANGKIAFTSDRDGNRDICDERLRHRSGATDRKQCR